MSDISAVPTGINPVLARILRPFLRFAEVQAAGVILLLVCTVLALLLANSPWAPVYQRILETPFSIGWPGFTVSETILHWINDGLMAIFFFVIGLEVKRELLTGELSTFRKASLPLMAAIGGMCAPALCYLLLNYAGQGVVGWGIPMATDIAFALGVLALLGKRVPVALKLFLVAFAIVDDIGVVLLIALFYTTDIQVAALWIGFGFFGLATLANWAGVRRPPVYMLIGTGMWLAFLESGIHATVAGVLLALTIPATAKIKPRQFAAQSRKLLEQFAPTAKDSDPTGEAKRELAFNTLMGIGKQAQPPLTRLEHGLHPWVTFTIMPIFALANAGVPLSGGALSGITGPVPLGILLGLFIGKPVGVLMFSWIAIRSGLAVKPRGVTWKHLLGAGWLGGIGFTMALFISGLAFPEGASLTAAKLGILCASLLSGTAGALVLLSAPVGVEDNETTD